MHIDYISQQTNLFLQFDESMLSWWKIILSVFFFFLPKDGKKYWWSAAWGLFLVSVYPYYLETGAVCFSDITWWAGTTQVYQWPHSIWIQKDWLRKKETLRQQEEYPERYFRACFWIFWWRTLLFPISSVFRFSSTGEQGSPRIVYTFQTPLWSGD